MYWGFWRTWEIEKERVKNMSDLLGNIPNHLYGDGFEVPNAPAFGGEIEKTMVMKLKDLRDSAVNPATGYLWGRDEHGVKSTDKKYWGKKKINSKHIAAYENARHDFAVKYSFVPYKIARQLSRQCHRGMGFDDLFNTGAAAIMNVIDKWPPFLGEVITDKAGNRKMKDDKGHRFLTSVRRAVHNAMCRFLDDFGRPIRVPPHMIEHLTVHFKIDDILYGKLKKKTVKLCCEGKDCACSKLHKAQCRRNKPGKYEHAIQKLAETLGIDIQEFDGKSLRDIAIETSEYRAVAEVVNIDVMAIISIVDATASLDTPVGMDGEETVGDMLPLSHECRMRLIKFRETLEEAMDKIPERNAHILRDYFWEGMSIRDIATKYGFSNVRANQMKNKSINQILSSSEAMNILNHKIGGSF
jgi:RNA polymerase sigma factor (sigma-70 family)